MFITMEERRLKKKKEKATEEGNLENVYLACKELGDVYLQLQYYEEALQEYKEAEKTGKILANNIFVAIANRMIGETLSDIGEFEEAIKHQKIHLELSKKEGDAVEQQRALATLGRTYYLKAESCTNTELEERKHCLDNACKYSKKSLDICECLGSKVGNIQFSEMKARLFINLALTMESQENMSSAFDFISKGIAICRKFDLWENLCRCYNVQGALFKKQSDTSAALHSFGEALEVAARLENKVQLSCELLVSKFEILVDLSDYKSAKHCLIQARKMKTPEIKERIEIERKLRIVLVMCDAESELLETSQTDYKKMKEINEKLGDCCVSLQRYGKAVKYYEKMLEFSLQLGENGKDLVAAFVSLSQTYKDDKQYDLALKYFYEELKLHNDDPAEACGTLMNIIEIIDLKRGSFEQIVSEYTKARILAKKANDIKLEIALLEIICNIQRGRGYNELADMTEAELNSLKSNLPTDLSEDDGSSDTDEMNDEIGAEIDLDDLSGMESENEEHGFRDRPSRKRNKTTFLMKRNEKGETPLHVAAAKGNFQLVRSLLKQGHPVDVQDAVGWLPLHEACNHGHVKVVEALLDAGANSDDRGGSGCEGVTPLHDAAASGHLDVIDLLLDKGASPLVRTDKGETVLDCLNACKKRVIAEEGKELDPITNAHFNSVTYRLEEALIKAGYNNQSVRSQLPSQNLRCNKVIKSSTSSEIRHGKFNQMDGCSNHRQICNNYLRKGGDNVDIEDPTDAALEYKNTIQALRKRENCGRITSEVVRAKSNLPALLNSNEVGDDWLEDDLHNIDKRPAKRKCENLIGTSLRMTKGFDEDRMKTKFNSTPLSRNNAVTKSSQSSVYSSNHNSDIWHELENDVELFDTDDNVHAIQDIHDDIERLNHFPSDFTEHNAPSEVPRRMKYQKSLFSTGFKRFSPSSTSTQEEVLTNSKSSFTSESRNQAVTSIQSIKVRIDGKLFLVPIPCTNDVLNIGWLVSEATRRYHNLEGVTPVLSLTSEDGALLDEHDPLSIVIDNREVQATVISWNLAPLTERYKDACRAASEHIDSYIELQLDVCQANSCLLIKDCPIALNTLLPALKAVSHYHSLTQIILSGINLQDLGFKHLVDNIATLSRLQVLDVNTNNITHEGLSHFGIAVSENRTIQSLESLNLSFNPLGDESAACLAKITQNLPHLCKLFLTFVDICCRSLYSSNFNLDCVESLDVSLNKLGREGVAKFLSALNGNKIQDLNLSATGGPEVVQECILFFERDTPENLVSLNLSNLNLEDNDVTNLIRSLHNAEQISLLNLSCNPGITPSSHKYVSNLKSIQKLVIDGCKLLTSAHQLQLPFYQLTLSSKHSYANFNEAPYKYITNAV